MIADPTNIDPIPGFGEPVSAITHLAAATVFACLSITLLKRGAGNSARSTALAIYAFAVVFQLIISGVCHMQPPGGIANLVLLRIDHAAIFFLIAATFTPIHTILFHGFARWGPPLLFWVAGVSGIVARTVFPESIGIALGASLYAGLGWGGIITGALIWHRFGFRFMAPLLYGGLFFTVGLLTEWAMAKPKVIQLVTGVVGGHEFFHLAVIAGISVHWAFIYRIADGRLPPAPPVSPS